MISNRARRQADLFYADLMGLPHPAAGRPFGEEDGTPSPNLRNVRLVFYDKSTLQYLDGWTRYSKDDPDTDRVFLIDRSQYDPIRERGRARRDALSDYLRRRAAGQRDLMEPRYVIEPNLHTVPLNPTPRGDWDDEMVSQLIGAGTRLSIQSEKDQWTLISHLLDLATKAAQAAGRNRIAQEYVAYFVLDVSKATLRLVQATNVKMVDDHAVIPVVRFTFPPRKRFPALTATNPDERLIGDIHTHALLDPDLTSTSTGMRTGMRLIHGVSDIDVAAAKEDLFVVYAIDSRFLHRANPDGSRNDRLSKVKDKGNVLREALRVFGGGEPALP
jgi:hypothetical protein